MITKSYSIPSPSSIRSLVREMTPDEIRTMNEQIAARRAAFLLQLHKMPAAQLAQLVEAVSGEDNELTATGERGEQITPDTKKEI